LKEAFEEKGKVYEMEEDGGGGVRIRVANLPKVGNPDKQFIRKKKRIRLLTLIV
jgi:hypothetical protein